MPLRTPPLSILCCGNISLDIPVRPVEELRWDTTTWVDSIEQNLGGNGSNTAYTLGMLGVPARLLGLVGNDAFGERVLTILRSAGVDLTFVGRSKAATTTVVALVNKEAKRMFLHQVGSSAEVFPGTDRVYTGDSERHIALSSSECICAA